MDPVQEVVAFVQKLIPEVPGIGKLAVDELIHLASSEGNAGLKKRFSDTASGVIARMSDTDDNWFPLPTKRAAVGQWHTLLASTLYFAVEYAINHDGSNAAAGAIQGFYLQQIMTKVDITQFNVAGQEAALVAAVGNALADLICPVTAASAL